MDNFIQFWKTHEKELKETYFSFLRFPSISSEPEYQEPVRTCALWLKRQIEQAGLEVEVWETAGHPVLFAKNMQAGPDRPTLLIYNHYDVQPVDPIDLWESPPFEPVQRGNEIYARGAQDNKGQCFYVLAALKAFQGKFPVNIKWVIEGEEECGSLSLATALIEHKKALKADYLAIVDLGIESPDTPSLTLGIRGIATMDLEITGTTSDLHSGSHGGLATNPLHALVKLLASARDPAGKVTIPGFYEGVSPALEALRQKLSLEFDPKEYEELFGAYPGGGEQNLSHRERNWLRPTLEINGVTGGYSGSGFKTVIPAKAGAKISCRLVLGQSPEKIAGCVKHFFESNAPKGVSVHVVVHPGGGPAVAASTDSKVVQAFTKAYTKIFSTPCEYKASGASIPIVAQLAETSGAETVLLGLGLSTDNIHAPNEHFGWDRIQKGFLSICLGLQYLNKETSP